MTPRTVQFSDDEGFPVYLTLECIECVSTVFNPHENEISYLVKMQGGSEFILSQESGVKLANILNERDTLVLSE